jgi:hypothetical protein
MENSVASGIFSGVVVCFFLWGGERDRSEEAGVNMLFGGNLGRPPPALTRANSAKTWRCDVR